MKKKTHPIQVGILTTLLVQPQSRFSELNTQKIPTDQFTFHLKRLLKLGMVKKLKDSSYDLTTKGKEFANRFDTQQLKIERQAKVGVLVCGVKGAKYLVQQRLKQPFYGYYGFVTGKIKWGETALEAAKREFKEETGLTGKPVLVGIEHKTDYSGKGKVLEDKFFFIFRVDEPQGELIKLFTEGQNIWLSEQEIKKLDKKFRDVEKVLKIIQKDKIDFWENKFVVPDY